ncbi:MAG: Dihydroneopterin aldolase [Chlamydiales bacterium]|nr:Dihydroneopterin aldolase [Chlamydiales bacterium]
MEGTIKIEEYKIHCVIGSHAYEREEEQEITMDIEMRLNFLECAQTDSIVDTIDYSAVALTCAELAKKRRYHLLETFAYEAVHALMDAFSPQHVKVRVKKKKAVPLAAAAVVELELSK